MPHSINFCKMHGLGNDFVVIDATQQAIKFTPSQISQLADRHRGIGFDQMLIVRPGKTADFSCDIFNADGSEAEQCGNGMRSVGRFLHENKKAKNNLTIATKAGIVDVVIHDYQNIQVKMGIPSLEPACDIQLSDFHAKLSILSMGNPHAILNVQHLRDVQINKIGAEISTHAMFPRGTNVGFMEIVDRNHIRLNTFERGVGETFACGSNACAAVVAGIKNHLLNSKVKVELTFGNLWIEWAGKNSPVFMTGPAENVFSGQFTI